MATEIYRNLLRHCVSVRDNGRVTGRYASVSMRDVTFTVRPAGVRRIRERHQREVIAWARGEITETSDTAIAIPAGARPVHFNPFVHDTFVLDDGTPVHGADVLVMHSPCGSYVCNPR